MTGEEKRYLWPEGKTCAFLFSVDVDAEAPFLWEHRGKRTQGLNRLEARRFGPRQGLGRILDLLDECDARGSFYVPGVVAEIHPEILPTVAARGHELGLHGYYHEGVDGLSAAEHRRIIDQCRAVFEKQVGFAPRGYRSPAWEVTPDLLTVLREKDFLYDSSLMGFDHPYSLGGVIEIPVQWLLDDAVYFKFQGDGRDRWHPADPRAVEAGWIEEFEGLREFGGLCTLTVHPWISGRAQRIRLLRRFLAFVRRRKDVWWVTARELAEYHRASANSPVFEVSPEPVNTNF